MFENTAVWSCYKENNWRLLCKKGVYCFFSWFLFLAEFLAKFWLTDLLNSHKAAFLNCFCWFAFCFREIGYFVQKNSVFQAASLGVNGSFEGGLWYDVNVTSSSFDSTAFFVIDVLVFERTRNRPIKNWPTSYQEPVSQQNKIESGPFSTSFACANEATVRN